MDNLNEIYFKFSSDHTQKQTKNHIIYYVIYLMLIPIRIAKDFCFSTARVECL